MEPCGVKKADCANPVFASLAADSDDEEEDPNCWADFIRRNKNILEVMVVLDCGSTLGCECHGDCQRRLWTRVT